MSAKRRRAKADRNRRAFPLTTALVSSDWVTSGRIACSYGGRDGNPCTRCGAEYVTPFEADWDGTLTPEQAAFHAEVEGNIEALLWAIFGRQGAAASGDSVAGGGAS